VARAKLYRALSELFGRRGARRVNGYKREMARLRQAETELVRARNERDTARSALSCVEGSASFKTGCALTAPPRACVTFCARRYDRRMMSTNTAL
jgi:hypothetical protein